jgi:hypothetical protein
MSGGYGKRDFIPSAFDDYEIVPLQYGYFY